MLIELPKIAMMGGNTEKENECARRNEKRIKKENETRIGIEKGK